MKVEKDSKTLAREIDYDNLKMCFQDWREELNRISEELDKLEKLRENALEKMRLWKNAMDIKLSEAKEDFAISEVQD